MTGYASLCHFISGQARLGHVGIRYVMFGHVRPG